MKAQGTMTTRHLILAVSSSMAMISWISCAAVADGVELRASTGNRMIVRTVSTTKSKPEPAADATTVMPSEGEIVFEDSAVFAESAPCEAGCCPGAPVCTSGCGMICAPIVLPNWHAIDGWVELDYLLWWRDGRYLPPLVTTQPNSGVLPDATVLFGGGKVDEHVRPGGRLDIGVWLDRCESLGLGVRYLGVGESPVRFQLSSDELGFFARPFEDVSVDPSIPTAFPIANDAAVIPTTGNISIRSTSEVHAGDVYLRRVVRRACGVRLDLLAGYQVARIDEDLAIDSLTITQRVDEIESLAVTDIFDTKNEYNAGYFGLQANYRRCNWGVDVLTRFAFGNMHQTVSISGATIATDANGGVDVRDSGLLAQAATNVGVHIQDEFAFMNDTGIKLSYYATQRFKLSLGYSLMYWSNVVRPGDEVNLNVDSRLLGDPGADPDPPITQPAFAFRTTDFLLQGINVGMQFDF